MSVLKRIFNYPYEHFIIAFFSLIGFSISVLIDKNQTQDNSLNSFIVIMGLAAAINLAVDILSPITRMRSQDRNLEELSLSRLNYNISFGIFSFFIFSFCRGYFVFYYEYAFNFIVGAFQWAGVFVALYSWVEKRKRASANS